MRKAWVYHLPGFTSDDIVQSLDPLTQWGNWWEASPMSELPSWPSGAALWATSREQPVQAGPWPDVTPHRPFPGSVCDAARASPQMNKHIQKESCAQVDLRSGESCWEFLSASAASLTLALRVSPLLMPLSNFPGLLLRSCLANAIYIYIYMHFVFFLLGPRVRLMEIPRLGV